jgi:hypothetical protein
LERIKEEIAKCEVVCCMCHRTRTWVRLHPEDSIMGLKHCGDAPDS